METLCLTSLISLEFVQSMLAQLVMNNAILLEVCFTQYWIVDEILIETEEEIHLFVYLIWTAFHVHPQKTASSVNLRDQQEVCLSLVKCLLSQVLKVSVNFDRQISFEKLLPSLIQ